MLVNFNPYKKIENIDLYKDKLASNTNKNQYEVYTFYEKKQKQFVSYVYELELGEKLIEYTIILIIVLLQKLLKLILNYWTFGIKKKIIHFI